MITVLDHISRHDYLTDLHGEDLSHLRPRKRMGTWDSDSGCSDISVFSDMEAKHSTSPEERTSHGTVKRRVVSSEPARTKVPRRVTTKSQGESPDCEPQLSSQRGQEDFSLPLAKSFPHKQGGLELVILRQPEAHHRARYQKEGSRGCIKDKTGNSCPALQLKGVTVPSILQIYVVTETGKIRPHLLYRACRVGGKRCTPSRDHAVGGTSVLELEILPENNGIINIDCLGILKLRNADLEMLSEEDTRKRRKCEPKVRLVFRAISKTSHGNVVTLQVVSTPICCTPSPGMPEITRVSHPECPAPGGLEVVIIGRNFLKDESKFFVVERNDDGDTLWEREIPLLHDHFHHVHTVGTIPPYKDLLIAKSVEVSLIVKNKQKISEPYPFKYIPDESVSRLLRTTSPSRLDVPKCRAAMRNATPSDATLPHSGHNQYHDLRRSSFSQLAPPSSSSIYPPTMPLITAAPPPPPPRRPSPPLRPSSVMEATLMDPDSGNGGINNNVLQYCIQPPGQNQPIFISFPQGAKVGVVEPMTAGGGVVAKSAVSVAGGLDSQYVNYPLVYYGSNYATTDLGSGLFEMNRYDSLLSGGDPLGDVSSDDTFLDQLLKDIMEPLS